MNDRQSNGPGLSQMDSGQFLEYEIGLVNETVKHLKGVDLLDG